MCVYAEDNFKHTYFLTSKEKARENSASEFMTKLAEGGEGG